MTLRRLLLLPILLFLPVSALAAESEQIYTIKKGDTLSGISQKFLKDPAYWPNLWANNPELTNPHFIEPGQQLRIYNGRIEIVPAKPGAEPTTANAAETAPTPMAGETAPVAPASESAPTAATAVAAPVDTILRAPAGVGFLSPELIDGVGSIVDMVENRILLYERDKVFIQMRQPANVGEKYSLIEVAEPVIHPTTGQPFGYRIRDLGMVEITEVGAKVATGIIRTNYHEILRGAKLIPYTAPVTEIALKRARQPLQGYLVDADTPRATQGPKDVVFLDLGAADGLAVGNLLYISRARHVTETADRSLHLELPDQLLGSAIVIETREHTANALILKVTGPVLRGDRVTAVTAR